MRKKISLFIIFSNILYLYGQQDSLINSKFQKEQPFHFEASYIGDFYVNAVGGLRTGIGYMGMGNLKIGFDTEKAGWWKGGTFFINGASIHGKSLSENFSGDLQVASNIDAGTHAYLHEVWFQQEFKKISFTVGLQDLNVNFVGTENGAEFINSSFGVPPVLSGNIPVPIFPLTGLGISAKWNINNIFCWQTAIFDGCQTPFEHNPYNLCWKISKDEGIFFITEFHSNIRIYNLDGRYKIGYFYHSELKKIDIENQNKTYFIRPNNGLYALIDQTIMQSEATNQKIGLFAQVAFCPNKGIEYSHYFGLGVNYYGIFNKEGKDILGLAVAHVNLDKTNHKHETALELFYKWQFNENISVQPDIQYIFNPSLTEMSLKNALVSLLRLHINL